MHCDQTDLEKKLVNEVQALTSQLKLLEEKNSDLLVSTTVYKLKGEIPILSSCPQLLCKF